MGTYDVVVVGAGPAGLVSALLAKQSGLGCLVVEKQAQDALFGHAHYLNQYTIRILRMLGVDTDELARLSTPVASSLKMAYCTTFSHVFAKVSCFSDAMFKEVWDQSDRYGCCLNVRYKDLMAALLKACSQQGVVVRWECRVYSLSSGLSSTISATSSHGDERFSARWVLACDGSHSSLASLLRMDYAHQKTWQDFISVELLADLSSVCHDPAILYWIYHPSLQACMVMHDVHSYQVLQIPISNRFSALPLNKNTLIQALRSVFDLVEGDQQRLDIGVVKKWSMQTSVLDTFRHHNVFFLGDSAHAMTPAGGLGLNTAIGDAVNLLWKIAGNRMLSKQRLLDTYEEERLPVAHCCVAASIENYQDFLSIPGLLGFSSQSFYSNSMVNQSLFAEKGNSFSLDQWGMGFLSTTAIQNQRALSQCRFIRALLDKAVSGHARHFKGIDQHLTFCYRSYLIGNPQAGCGDYALDYEQLLPGRMVPAVRLSHAGDFPHKFIHEFIRYPRWCCFYHGTKSFPWPSFLSEIADSYVYGEDFSVSSHFLAHQKRWVLLLRPDGIVAFYGDSSAFQKYLSHLMGDVDGECARDGDDGGSGSLVP